MSDPTNIYNLKCELCGDIFSSNNLNLLIEEISIHHLEWHKKDESKQIFEDGGQLITYFYDIHLTCLHCSDSYQSNTLKHLDVFLSHNCEAMQKLIDHHDDLQDEYDIRDESSPRPFAHLY